MLDLRVRVYHFVLQIMIWITTITTTTTTVKAGNNKDLAMAKSRKLEERD